MVGLRQGRILTLVCVLFTSCSADLGLDTESSTVPDGMVYTDLKRDLIIGNPGVLPCRFYGGPVAVTWLKRTVPQTAPIQLVWHDGAKSGSRFDDGTYDIDDNYSLIIKDVQVTDMGRYICRVSNQGVFIQNYTDVTLLYNGLETESEISLEKGLAGILPCKMNLRPTMVTWKKGPTYSSAKILVAIDKDHNVSKISGPGYEEGLISITADFSLVIVYVDYEVEGQYFCEMLEVDTDNIFQDSTNVSVFERDDNTTVEPRYKNCGCDQTELRLYVASGVAAAAIIVILIIFAIYFRKKLWYRSESSDSTSSHTLARQIEDDLTTEIPSSHPPSRPNKEYLTKDCISNVELWKLVVYSANNEENDKLAEVILQLTGDKQDIPTLGYGTCITDYERTLAYFQPLCHWKKSCAGTEQKDKLFRACSLAKMEKTVKELEDFLNEVYEGLSEYDLEHILWQIGKNSSDKITTLLGKLTNCPFDQESSLSGNVRRALPKLQKWRKGNHAIHPAVTLSLQSDDLCIDDMYFFKVPDREKCPLKDTEIEEHARNVSKAHCQKIISIVSTKGKSKRKKAGKVVNTVLDENEMDLFNTYQMIKEWLDEQECSNYEKRITLRKAVGDAKEAFASNEINLDEIEQLASSKGNAEAAYELLMKDIKPFAFNLGLDESKLTKYKQLSPSSQSTRGTIGLVADLRPKKGKK